MASIIGIDNGLNGATAIIDAMGVTVHPMPVIISTLPPKKGGKHKRHKRVYDLPAIRDLIHDVGSPTVYIEKTQAMTTAKHRESAVSAHAKGVQFGNIEGMCLMANIPYVVVLPRVWQAVMYVGIPPGDTKARSLIAAKRLFPSVALRRTDKCTTDSDGMADALLIAEYGRRQQGVTV